MRFIRRPKFEFSVFSFGIFDPRESLNVETLSILFLKEIVGRMKNPHLNEQNPLAWYISVYTDPEFRSSMCYIRNFSVNVSIDV